MEVRKIFRYPHRFLYPMGVACIAISGGYDYARTLIDFPFFTTLSNSFYAFGTLQIAFAAASDGAVFLHNQYRGRFRNE